MAKKILFPFSVDTPYYEGYSWAMELASKMEADLWLFTASKDKNEETVQHIFHSLLEAQGYYLQLSSHHPRNAKIKTERWIETGNLKNALLSFLKSNPVEITVLDSSLPMDKKSESEVIDFSRGAIVLPKKNEKQSPSENKFYEKLQNAELYKLPENFYNTLSHDSSLFNYLRKVFKKNVGS
ncbi:MAG TPA: hypothetical protein VIT44_01755 [Cyclobacteriaceae bacterium]